MGFFNEVFTAGGFGIGGDKDPFFGGAQAAKAEKAAFAQAEQAEAAEARLREDLRPFREFGTEALGQFEAPFQLDRDPSRVIDNPLFQALSKQQNQDLINQQAALGRGGSGETSDLLTQNVLRLGSEFQQQDFQTQLAENAQRFQQLFNQVNLGQASAAQAALQGADLSTGAAGTRTAGVTAAGNIRAEGTGQAVKVGGGLLAAFSDVRLKENIRYIRTDDGVDAYDWDWTEDAEKLVGDQESFGPIAQLVQEINPSLVTTHESGYLQVANNGR